MNICHSPCYWNSYCDDQVLKTLIFSPTTSTSVELARGNIAFMVCGDYLLWTNWTNRYYFSGPIWLEPKFLPLKAALSLSKNAPHWWVEAPHESFSTPSFASLSAVPTNPRVEWTLNAAYDPEDYNNDYEIRCVLNQNASSNILCLAEDQNGTGAPFMIRCFDLADAGRVVYQQTIEVGQKCDSRQLCFYWPYFVFYRTSELKSEFVVIDVRDPTDTKGRVLFTLPAKGRNCAPMAAVSNDGSELVYAYVVDQISNNAPASETAYLRVHSLLDPSFPVVDEYSVSKHIIASYAMKFTKLAICRSKISVIQAHSESVLEPLLIISRSKRDIVCTSYLRLHGWHLSAPFRFINPRKLLVASDDVYTLDFAVSRKDVRVAVIGARSAPYLFAPTRVAPEDLISKAAEHLGCTGAASVGIRSLIVSETATARVILLYVRSEETEKEPPNVCATAILKWVSGIRRPQAVELTPNSTLLNGFPMGRDSTFPSYDWAKCKEIRVGCAR